MRDKLRTKTASHGSVRFACSSYSSECANFGYLDEAHRLRCMLDRMRQFRDAGTTLLFVSHDLGAIKTLCDRAILLDEGVVLRDDMPDAVTSQRDETARRADLGSPRVRGA